nr:DivIVA domain-containing protein [uncultured Agathobaculum sp.]
MTVQEIQEIGFEKAVFGGYDMKSVDTFLERVAEEFAAMQKENAALKAKMKVLVDKIEEYRGVEDGMRRALMSAQTIAQDTIDKAKQEAQDIVTAAKDETENKVKNTRDEITLEEQKLETAKKSTLEFVARISAAYQAQAKALVELAKSEKLVGQQQEPAVQPASPQPPVQQQAPVQPATQEEQADAPIEDATRKFDFGELKFGADYDPKEVK